MTYNTDHTQKNRCREILSTRNVVEAAIGLSKANDRVTWEGAAKQLGRESDPQDDSQLRPPCHEDARG